MGTKGKSNVSLRLVFRENSILEQYNNFWIFDLAVEDWDERINYIRPSLEYTIQRWIQHKKEYTMIPHANRKNNILRSLILISIEKQNFILLGNHRQSSFVITTSLRT